MKKIISLVLFLFSIPFYASTALAANLTIDNQTYGEAGENVYATIKVFMGNWLHGTLTLPERSIGVYTLPTDAPPMFLSVDVWYRNKPLENKHFCTRPFNQNAKLKLTITSKANPIDIHSMINCHWTEY